jgi:hypothetical protein
MDEFLEQQEKTALEKERAELNLLVQRGFKFDVSIRKRKKTFEIHEPTLAILDRISDISLDMVIDEDELNHENEDAMASVRKIVKKNTKRQATIIAISVLGESFYTNIPILKQVLNFVYRIRLLGLTNLFYHSVTPSKLLGLAIAVTNMSNYGDFIVSMRLLSGARTTQPRKESIE